MPNLTTPFLNLKGEDINVDMNKVQEWSMQLIEELKYILCNLDAGNVTEANSVKAKNIDCRRARIKSCQIQSLVADKIKTGTLDVSENVTIKGEGEDARLDISAQKISFYERDDNGNEILRIYIGYDGYAGKYLFDIYDKNGTKSLCLNDDGEAEFRGTIQTEKDCLIQGELRVGLRGDNTKGIAFYGDAYFPDENGNYSLPYARIVPVLISDDDGEGNKIRGINVTGGGLYVDEIPAATVADINELQRQITILQNALT